MICTSCACCESVCSCEEPTIADEAYCENCGTIGVAEDFTEGLFCGDCEEAYEEYRENMVSLISDNVGIVITATQRSPKPKI